MKLIGNLRADRLLAMLAVVAGVAGFWLARQYLSSADQALAQRYASRYESSPVLVAAQNLNAGESLVRERLAARAMPQRFLPSTSVAAAAVDDVLNSRLRAPVKAGDPIERNLLLSPQSSIAQQLKPGWRALALLTESLGPVGALLHAGDHIDLWLGGTETGNDVTHANRLMPDIEVIANAQLSEGPAAADGLTAEHSVTLRVTAAQALRILEALRVGAVAALLRSNSEQPFTADDGAMSARRSYRRRLAGLDEAVLFASDGQNLQRRLLRVSGAGTNAGARP